MKIHRIRFSFLSLERLFYEHATSAKHTSIRKNLSGENILLIHVHRCCRKLFDFHAKIFYFLIVFAALFF